MYIVTALSEGVIHFKPHDPTIATIRPDFYMPGGTTYDSVNPFGNLLFQTIERNEYKIFRSIYVPTKDITLRVENRVSWMGFRLMIKKHLRHVMDGKVCTLLQGQVNFSYIPSGRESEFWLKKGERYEIFDMEVSAALLKKIKIKQKRYEQFLDQMGASEPVFITERPTWGNAEMLDAIELLSKDPRKDEVAEEVVKKVILAITARPVTERVITEHHLESLYSVREEIKSNYWKQMNLQDWSIKAGMNITYFKEMFKEVFGITPYRYLLYERIKAAKEIMINEPYSSLSEVALRCGFTNYNNLRRAFLAQEKITLSDWRNMQDLLSFLFFVQMMVL